MGPDLNVSRARVGPAAAGGTRTTIRFRSQIGFIRCPDLPEVPDSIAAVELYREPLVAFMRADHRLAAGGKSGTIAVSALASEPFVFFPRGLGTSLYDQVMTLCRRAGFSPRIEQEARANATILGLVAAGLGVSLLPESLQRVAAKGVACRALSAAGARARFGWSTFGTTGRLPAACSLHWRRRTGRHAAPWCFRDNGSSVQPFAKRLKSGAPWSMKTGLLFRRCAMTR